VGWHLGDVERQPKDLRVGLAKVDKTRGNKLIHKPVQFELADPTCIDFARLVADRENFQFVFSFKIAN
jgi:hypothetical protein